MEWVGESEGHTKKDRSRVERVFGFMERTMSGLAFHGVGKVRTDADIALTYFSYNICRLVRLMNTAERREQITQCLHYAEVGKRLLNRGRQVEWWWYVSLNG